MSSEGRARIGLAALLLLTLLAFAQVFAAGDYPGPTLLGMALASGIAIAARRLGAGTVATALASLAALFWYLVVIFQARNSFYLLPSPDAVAGLGRSISNALRHSAVDYAPVPVRTGYVVLVVVGMWVATSVGEIATFRWRRPLLAALPCIGLFCIQMTVGTGNGAPVLVIAFLLALLTFWGLESAHRVRSWGRWVPAFSGREGKEPESVTGALARRMGAGCVAAAIAAPLIVPALGDGLLVWRNDVGAGGFGGGGASGEINPLVSIAPTLLDQTDLVLFTVEAERSSYWRLLSLARFDGRDWQRAEGTVVEPVIDELSFGGQSNAPRESEPLVQTVTFQELESERLPAAINPAEVDLEEDVEVTYDTQNQDLVLPDQATEGFSYTVTSNVPELTYEELTKAQVGFPGGVYLEAPDATSRTIELAEDLRVDRVTGERLSDGQFLIALQEELRTKFEYSDDPELVEATQVDGASANYLDQFLFEVRQGYCQQFATAFALLARLQGIPTRVAVGFLPGNRDVQTDTFTVTGVETHAWPEVYFEGYGWVRFDPTPRVQAAAPGYTRQPLGPQGPGAPPGGTENGIGAATGRQDAIEDRRLAGSNVGAGTRGERAIGEIGPGAVPENPAWTRAFNRLAVAVGVLLLAFLAAVPALKRWRIARRYRSARGADQAAAAAFRHFEDEAAELAEPRRPAESAASFAARLGKLRAVPSDDAARLAQIYEASQYAPRGVGRDQARQARVLARKLRAVMWARASWWTRAARLFSPRGLVGRS